MKIAHIADSHWGFGYPGPNPEARFEDITLSMDWSADRIIAEGCELVLFAGDAFKDARVFIDRATAEIQAFVAWLRKLSNAGIEIVVISGTPSHDAISAYHLIREMQISGVQVFTEPGTVHVKGINIACLPGMNRSSFALKDEFAGLPPHEFHAKMTDWITDECRGMADYTTAYLAGQAIPTILMSHLTFDLADTGFEDALLQNEPILTNEAAKMFDLVCLGHIHRPQKAGSNVYYSGAPERHNFGDEHTTPGFYIHQWLDSGQQFESKFIETPSRRFKTIDWCDMDIEAWLDGQIDDFADIQDAIVRVRYSCSEELQKRFDRRSLEKALYNAGAFFVAEIRAEVERSERIRDTEVTEGLNPLTALAAWGTNQEIKDSEIVDLQAMTTELMEVTN